MKIFRFTPVFLAIFFLTSCAGRKPAPINLLQVPYSPITAERDEVVSLPTEGARSEVEVGQSMVSTALRSTTPAIETKMDIVHKSERMGLNSVTFRAGKFYLSGENREGKFYRSSNEVLLSRATTSRVVGGLFIPNQTNNPTKVYWFPHPNSRNPDADDHPSIDYKATTVERWGSTSFKRELVYSGVSQNTISILYREFKDDMARPAFSQELKYDLAQGRSIGYRGARFEIERATNISITFKVLKSLD
ncbi:hypothetical protein [Pseudoduganella violacea]|uniref:Lipoprotein n=1 Tax=Pseudoduganella violacea TaxID=1715466 RepID=A0A7W5BFN3_9BURK|nr:hypothetical protein [Pseudoduganella violacea]MBB3122279.1 hypothetical protein [Pseudoduganella violacea]